MKTVILQLILAATLESVFTQSLNLKICSSAANDDACQQIGRDGKLTCSQYRHSVDCLLGLENNQSHVGRITGETAVLAANLISDNVVVLGEINKRHPPIQTVVIVKTNIPDGFENLRNRKLCHAGYKHDNSISNILLAELEGEIIKLNDSLCSLNGTLIERQIRIVHDFFGESCSPGPWSKDKNFDQYLKQKYGSLCNLCGLAKCDIDYKVPFNDSLNCLLDNGGDVATSSLSESIRFFNSSQNQQNYKYLCKNGTSTAYTSPCVWSSELPDLLVTESSVADQIKTYLEQNLQSKIANGITPLSLDDNVLEKSLVSVLALRPYESINLTSNYKSLISYVYERRSVPVDEVSIMCSTTMRWCTYTDADQQKCLWLRQAAMNWGIQPVVQCVRSDGDDELSCLDDIQRDHADIFVASSDQAYVTVKKGLVNLAFPETYNDNVSVVLAVKRTNDSSITKFEDLRGKGVCLPRFGGKEHLVFVDTARKLKAATDANCDYGKVLSDFVGDSCTPGVRSNLIREASDYVDKDKLCSLCGPKQSTITSSYCNDNPLNKYFGNEGSLQCLVDNVASFAVVTQIDYANATEFTVICKNNTLASYPGLTVDTNCALNVITSSQVVANQNSSLIEDMKLALHEFEYWFGQDLNKIFHLFDEFNKSKDLLFKDSTPGLDFDVKQDYVKNYEALLKNTEVCSSGAASIETAIILLCIAFLTLLKFNF